MHAPVAVFPVLPRSKSGINDLGGLLLSKSDSKARVDNFIGAWIACRTFRPAAVWMVSHLIEQ